MSNWCDKCGSAPLRDCSHFKEADALNSPRGKLAARLLEARISAFGSEGLASPQGLATAAVQRADALIKELLK